MTSPDSPTPDWVTSFPDTATPDWAAAVPATPAVHPKETGGLTRPLTNQQLAKIGKELLEQFLRRVVLALSGLFFPNAPALDQLIKWAQDLIALLGSMDSLTDWKAASGTNLFPSPHFDALNLKRSPVAPAQVCDYSTEQHHSGLRSWKWMHFPSTDSGLILAPTPRVDYVEVGPTESWFAEAWVHPKSTNSTATGSIRIGATFTDSSGVKAATDLYLDCPLNGPDMVKGQFNKINVTVDVPDGMDRAVFWVKSTAATADSSIFYVDDVVLREETFALKARVLADMANFVVDMRARAGSNLVVSPTFSNAAVTRFPINTNQICGYASGAGEQKHSGFQSWKWTQKTSAACGLVLQPTINYDSIEVKASEGFFVESWLYPASGNSTSTGAIRIGATFTDSSGALSPTDLYNEFPLSGPDMVKGQWNKVNVNLDVPSGFDTAKFWAIATSDTAAGCVFWIDDVTVREDTESKAALAQANFANAVTDMKARAGTNAVYDPRLSLGPAVTRFPYNVAQDFDYTIEQHHTGIWSWKWTQKTSAACGLILAPTPKYDKFQVAAGESYFVEGFFFPKSTNGTSGAVRIGATLTDSTGTLSPVDMFVETALSAAGATRNQWNRLNCTLNIQDGYDTAQFWIITTSATAAGNVFYVDDACVRETTHPQSIVDKIHEAILGAVPSSPQPVGTVADRLKTAWSNFWDGLNGSTGSTGKLPSDVQTVAAAVRSTASTANTNATTAQASAATAQTTANTVTSDLSTALNGVAQGMLGGATTATPTTVRDKILAAWAQLYDGLNGSSGSTARLMTEVGTASAAVRSTANTASTNATTAQSTASGAQSAISATNTALYGGTSAGSTILPAALPTKLQTVGSGFVMRKTSGTISVSCSANTATAIKFPTSAYDSTASNTGDYTLSTGGSGELRVSAANAGWYMVEVAFGADQNARAVGYRLSAAMFLNGSLHKIGSTVDYYGSLSTQFPFCAQASFIVYLSASDYITPGAMLYSQSTISSLPLIATNMNRDSYFAVSLLNRSLA